MPTSKSALSNVVLWLCAGALAVVVAGASIAEGATADGGDGGGPVLAIAAVGSLFLPVLFLLLWRADRKRHVRAGEQIDQLTVRIEELVASNAAGGERIEWLENRLRNGVEADKERFEALVSAAVAMARRVQVGAHATQAMVEEFGEGHHDPAVVALLMRVSHQAAQQARQAQNLPVLLGEWPGQQWDQPMALMDAVQAASGRILDYTRVNTSGDATVGVVASLVEPLVHALAELLANATQCSPPAASVEVTIRRVQLGAVVQVDDSGLGLSQEQLGTLPELISGQRLVPLEELGEPPQTGLAVVGRFVRRHGWFAGLEVSPYGGGRAWIRIPSEYVVTVELPDTAAHKLPDAAVHKVAALTLPTPPEDGTAEIPISGSSGQSASSDTELPQRRSRRQQHAGPDGGASRPMIGPAATHTPPGRDTSPAAEAAWMAGLFSGDDSTVGNATTTHYRDAEDENQ